MQTLLSFLKNIVWEIFVVLLFFFCTNNYLGGEETSIAADGMGYYEYLPSAFYYHDINRKDKPVSSNDEVYARINKLQGFDYNDYKDHKLNKYPCGTAVLISPFFFIEYCINPNIEPYSPPFKRAVFYAALFYVFLGIFFLKKLLLLYEIKPFNIVFVQLLTVMATSVPNYVYKDPAFSHVYSLFAVSAFSYFVKSYFVSKNIRQFVWACFFLALIALIRNVNVIIIFFIPFLAGSWQNLKEGIANIFKYPLTLVLSALMMSAIVFIQCVFWYLQVGEWIVYSYGDESFNFLSPAFFDILFSYKKGLFVYTPVLFLSLFGLIRLVYNKQYYLFFTWLFCFVAINYVLSSWWSWWYGASFGLRAYIEFYPVFFVLFALFINKLLWQIKIPVVLISLCAIPLALIQTWQFSVYILDYNDMTKKDYWEIFLKQDDKFRGYLWKREYNLKDDFEVVKKINIGNKTFGIGNKPFGIRVEDSQQVFRLNSDSIPGFDKVCLVQVKFENEFDEQNETRVYLSINDLSNNENKYYHDVPLIHFAEEGLNHYHKGLFNFEIPKISNPNQLITCEFSTVLKNETFKNIEVTFYKSKWN